MYMWSSKLCFVSMPGTRRARKRPSTNPRLSTLSFMKYSLSNLTSQLFLRQSWGQPYGTMISLVRMISMVKPSSICQKLTSVQALTLTGICCNFRCIHCTFTSWFLNYWWFVFASLIRILLLLLLLLIFNNNNNNNNNMEFIITVI